MLYIASDHGGLDVKTKIIGYLQSKSIAFTDLGPFELDENDDFVDYAYKAGKLVTINPEDKGILICKSGIGMSIAVNKIEGVRAGYAESVLHAQKAREDDDINVLVLDVFTFDSTKDFEIINAFLDTKFKNTGNYLRRKLKVIYHEKSGKDLHPIILEKEISELKTKFELAKTYTNYIDIDLIDWSKTTDKTANSDQISEYISSSSQDFLINFDLMVDFAEYHIKTLSKLKSARFITVNTFCKDNLSKLISLIHEQNKEAGISLNPDVSVESISHLLSEVEFVQIMTVEPGKQGNPFLPGVLKKSLELKKIGFKGRIGIDGGVNISTLEIAKNFPIDIFGAGSAIVKSPDPAESYKQLSKKLL